MRALRLVAVALFIALAAIAALPFALDTPAGRAWLVQQLPRLVLENGLSFRVARIEGSLWGSARLSGIAIHDARGRFATIDALALDWTPLALAYNQFEAASIDVPHARLERLPSLLPTRDPRLLPAQDIIIDRFHLGRLDIAAGIAGPARTLTARGKADIRAGRALVALAAEALGGGDALTLQLDAEPDRDRFALDARLNAPAGGLVTTLAGLEQPLTASATGKGRWRQWSGQMAAQLGSATLADLALTGTDGSFTARGRIDPAALLNGATRDALAGGLAMVAEAAPDGDLTRVMISLDGRQLAGQLRGRLDRAEERWRGADARLSMADGSALSRLWGIEGGVLTAKLAGPWLAPLIDARVSARRLALPGGYALSGLTVAGIADVGEKALSIPITASANGLSGQPATLQPLAGKWRADGRLVYTGGTLKADNMAVTSGPLAARIGFSFVPASSAWGVTAAGDLRGWAVPQLGQSDVKFRASLKPGINGNGDFRLIAARPPTGGLTRLTGGGVALSGRFALLPSLAVTLSDLALSSPRLAAAGRAGWANGRFTLAATGKSLDYGPFQIDGAGTPAAPQFTARLDRPGYGLTAVAVRLDPAGAGWRLTGDAQSSLGPITLIAGIGLSPALRLDVERLAVAGFAASGELVQSATGPFVGALAVKGQGLEGNATLRAAGSVQEANASLAGNALTLALSTPVNIDRLRLTARLRLPDSGPDIAADLDVSGLERGSLVLERGTGKLQLENGRGTAGLTFDGRSEEKFHLAFTGDITPGRWAISGGGDYAGRAAKLAAPAVITRDDAGWHLAPVTLVSALGNAELAGDWGATKRINARLDKASLQMLNIAYPSLNLAGRVSGTLALAQSGDAAPIGTAALRLNGLSRSNITSTSTPIDVGMNAALGAGGTVVRAVIVRAGQVEGRAQAQLGAIPAGDTPLPERLLQASVTGQLRYAGPAQDLWGLSGLTALDVRGPVQVAADLAGTLGDPRVSGVARATGGRVEAPLLGAVATDVTLDARFTAAKLELTRFSGKSGQGSISGSGSIDLSYDRGFPMDIRMVAKDAAILGRDDLTATGSGAIRLATDEYGGVVSGNLTVARANYTVGRTAVADVPVLAVTEKNSRLLGRRTLQYVAPTRWLFNLAIKADRRLLVSGMGISSEWQADVRVRGGATAPELFGRVQLVRGDYEFAGKRFQLTRGDIRFVGGFPADPIINVTAENSGNGFTAFLNVEGTAQKPQIKFSSVPALPEDEVLSRVLFGSSVTNLSAPEAIQLAGALTSLRGGGFNPIGAVSKGLGIDRLRILPADIATGRKTTVAAGQYVGRNIYVELATDAQGYTATSIEIGLTRTLSVLSSVATLGGTSGSVRWKKDY